MNAKDINAKWQAEINDWTAHDKVDQSTSEEAKNIYDKVINGKAKWWYDPYDCSWHVMTNDEVPVLAGHKYIYIGETNKMKKVKQYKDEDKSISKRVGKVALVFVAVLGLGSGIVGITAAGQANERADKIDAKIAQMQKQEDSTNKSIQLLVESTDKLGNTSTQDAEWMKSQVDTINAKLVELGK